MMAWFAELSALKIIGLSVLGLFLLVFTLLVLFFMQRKFLEWEKSPEAKARLRVARILMGLVVLVFVTFILWKVPKWQVANLKGLDTKARFDKENEARKTVAQILGGFALLIGIYFTWRNLIVAKEGQITERFTRAIEQLGSEQLEVKLGGIYALERIARDSEKDHWPIMEVLTTYVRENTPWPVSENDHDFIGELLTVPTQEKAPWPLEEKSVVLEKQKTQINEYREAPHSDQLVADKDKATSHKPKPDIQAILTVIGRRSRTFGRGERQRLNLSHTDLRGADLRVAHLEHVNLYKTHLEHAKLGGAYLQRSSLLGVQLERSSLGGVHLEGANLTGARMKMANLTLAQMKGANLMGAHLELAFLNYADLKQVNLWRARLESANLQEAHLEGADLQHADLKGAKNLTEHQVRQARKWVLAFLPEELSAKLGLPPDHHQKLKDKNLSGYNLEGANLRGADLVGFNLKQANLKGTHLEGADLTGATGLTREQIDSAIIDDQTILPDYLQKKGPNKTKSQ